MSKATDLYQNTLDYAAPLEDNLQRWTWYVADFAAMLADILPSLRPEEYDELLRARTPLNFENRSYDDLFPWEVNGGIVSWSITLATEVDKLVAWAEAESESGDKEEVGSLDRYYLLRYVSGWISGCLVHLGTENNGINLCGYKLDRIVPFLPQRDVTFEQGKHALFSPGLRSLFTYLHQRISVAVNPGEPVYVVPEEEYDTPAGLLACSVAQRFSSNDRRWNSDAIFLMNVADMRLLGVSHVECPEDAPFYDIAAAMIFQIMLAEGNLWSEPYPSGPEIIRNHINFMRPFPVTSSKVSRKEAIALRRQVPLRREPLGFRSKGGLPVKAAYLVRDLSCFLSPAYGDAEGVNLNVFSWFAEIEHLLRTTMNTCTWGNVEGKHMTFTIWNTIRWLYDIALNTLPNKVTVSAWTDGCKLSPPLRKIKEILKDVSDLPLETISLLDSLYQKYDSGELSKWCDAPSDCKVLPPYELLNCDRFEYELVPRQELERLTYFRLYTFRLKSVARYSPYALPCDLFFVEVLEAVMFLLLHRSGFTRRAAYRHYGGKLWRGFEKNPHHRVGMP